MRLEPKSVEQFQKLHQTMRSPRGELSALRKACRDFEAIFVKQLLSSSRSGTPGEAMFGPDVASDIMWDMQDQSLAESVAASRGLGLGRILEEQLGERLLAQSNAAATKTAGATEGEA